MGLFGGFKAKFTKNSTPKNKPQEVVCLRYHVHAEFDRPDFPAPVKVNNDVKRNELVRNHAKKKNRKAVTKSAVFPDSHTSQSSLSSSTPQKSLSLNNLRTESPIPTSIHENGQAETSNAITVSTTFSMPSNGKSVAISDTKFGRSIDEHKGTVTEKVAVVTNSHLYTMENNSRNEQHEQRTFQAVSTYNEDKALTNGEESASKAEVSYLKPSLKYKSSVKESGQDNDQSTLIFMTQHSSRSSSFDRNMQTDDIPFSKNTQSSDTNKTDQNGKVSDDNFNITFVPNHATSLQENYNGTMADDNFNFDFVPNHATSDDETDYFKINIVKHDPNKRYSFSEDERSYQEEEEPRFTRMGYSSQAASIFFGEGEEAEVVRPRRIQLTEDDDDDERRSSGADC